MAHEARLSSRIMCLRQDPSRKKASPRRNPPGGTRDPWDSPQNRSANGTPLCLRGTARPGQAVGGMGESPKAE
eukprot:6047884-Pyramimonas_sp.AAC.2